MDETIEISKSEYDELIQAQIRLICLESAGVDNWRGYDYALELMEEYEVE